MHILTKRRNRLKRLSQRNRDVSWIKTTQTLSMNRIVMRCGLLQDLCHFFAKDYHWLISLIPERISRPLETNSFLAGWVRIAWGGQGIIWHWDADWRNGNVSINSCDCGAEKGDWGGSWHWGIKRAINLHLWTSAATNPPTGDALPNSGNESWMNEGDWSDSSGITYVSWSR